MKNILLTIAAVLFFGITAYAAEPATITVTGSGEVTMMPDIATVTFDISTTDPDSSTALTRNNATTEAVMQALRSAGIQEDDLTTTRFSVNPQHRWEGGTQILIGYIASISLRATIRDIDTVGHILAAATDAGATRVGNVQFSIQDSSAAYNQALALAVANAASRANAIATAVGGSISGVVSVTETGGTFQPVATADTWVEPMMMAEADARFTDVPVQAGELTVRANVRIVYSLQQ